MLAGSIRVEAAEPPVFSDQPGGTPGCGVVVVFEIEVRSAEVVYRRHCGLASGLAQDLPRFGLGEVPSTFSSELSARLALPRKPSRTTWSPSSDSCSSTPLHFASRPMMELRIRLSLTRLPCSSDTLGPISLRSMVTPSSI